jgi:iron complex transport system ATP-binding protein
MIDARNLAIGYGTATIVPDLSLSLKEGKVTALVGPNGSGKSTILRAMARLLKPQQGSVYLDGRSISDMSTKEVARHLAILPQSPDIPAGVTVRELIGYGRYPYQGILARQSDEDREAIEWAIGVAALEPFASRAVDTLSGGERQRAWIAMALAQRTGILLLDEPTTYLDIRHQQELLSLVRQLNHEHGLTVGLVLHDLNQAATHSDHMIVLSDGRIYAEGPPHQIMTPAVINAVFGVEVTVLSHPQSGIPICLFGGACPLPAREVAYKGRAALTPAKQPDLQPL